MTKQKTIFLFTVLLISILLFTGCIENGDATTYKVIFSSTWSKDTHPGKAASSCLEFKGVHGNSQVLG